MTEPFSTPQYGHNVCFQTTQSAYKETFQMQKEHDQNGGKFRMIDQGSFTKSQDTIASYGDFVKQKNKINNEGGQNIITTVTIKKEEVSENMGTDLEIENTTPSYRELLCFEENNEINIEANQNTQTTMTIKTEKVSENMDTDLEIVDMILSSGDLFKDNSEMNNERNQNFQTTVTIKRDEESRNMETDLEIVDIVPSSGELLEKNIEGNQNFQTTVIIKREEVSENMATVLESQDTTPSCGELSKESHEINNKGNQNATTNVTIQSEEISENIGTHLESQDTIPSCGQIFKENNKLNNEGKQIKNRNIEVKKDNTNFNLEKGFKNTEATELSLKVLYPMSLNSADVPAAPPRQPGASLLLVAPTVQNNIIKFGETQETIMENSNSKLEAQIAEKKQNVEGNEETEKYISEVNKSEKRKEKIKEINKLLETSENPGSKYDLSDYSCKLCNKTYDSQKALKIHFAKFHKIKIPGSRKPELVQEVICDHCGKTYNRLSNLRHHIKNKHYNVKSKLFDKTTSEEVLRCERCSLECKTKATLAIHMTTHTGKRKNTLNKTYVCSICGHAFSCNSNLKTHMRRHTKEYLYNCSECGRGYFRKTDLSSHLRTHSGERPFPCLKCPRRFSRRDGLNTHMKLHTDERPFACKYCESSFVNATHLRVHMQRSKKCLKIRVPTTPEQNLTGRLRRNCTKVQKL